MTNTDAKIMREANAWQPIETAPIDGRDVQLWGEEDWTPQAHWCPAKGGWYQSYWDADWRTYGEAKVYRPTHWMPLPEAPGATS